MSLQSNSTVNAMPAQRKLVIQMSGVPGSGKSTLGKLLGQAIDAIVIDHDLLRSFFLDNNIPFDQSAKQAYGLQWLLAEDLIKQGRSVVFDSTCNYQETLDRGSALAKQYDYEYKYVECKVNDVDLLDLRLQTRVSLRSQRTGVNKPPVDVTEARHNEDYRVMFQKWIEKPVRPTSGAIFVDSTNGPETCLEDLLNRIQFEKLGQH